MDIVEGHVIATVHLSIRNKKKKKTLFCFHTHFQHKLYPQLHAIEIFIDKNYIIK